MPKSKKRGSGLAAWAAILLFIVFCLVIAALIRGKDIPLLTPKGTIADEQYQLLVTSTFIMVVFALLVISVIYYFAWKYRETNHKATYNPSAGRSKLLLLSAWAAPMLVFVVLASIMLPATQKLEPQRSIESDNEELTIRVIAMRWKWLFLYPEQDIATVNYVQIPVDTPVRFELTADEAPMNSFWIPHLGGMLYAMTEHVNPLNLMAHTVGSYDGGAAEVNGHGFAGMRFTADVSTIEDFNDWVYEIAQQSGKFDTEEYEALLEPSEYDTAAIYHSPNNEELFDNLLKKYEGSHGHYDDTEHKNREAH